MVYFIKADNPKGLAYDLVYETREGASIAVRNIIRRGARNVTINGVEVADHVYEMMYV